MSDNQTIADFVAAHDRLPLLDLGERPWSYRGWLVAYVQAMHAHPGVDFPDRWGYLAKIKLGDRDPGPIPRIAFRRPDNRAAGDIQKAVEIAGRYGSGGWGWSAFRAYLDWLGFGLGVTTDPPRLDDATNEALYRFVNLQPWLESPYDYLGAYICEMRGRGWNPNAFYPTPHEVVECMVAMQIADSPGDNRWKSALDCCVGTGRMLLHASNYSLRLFGTDIDPMMVLCTKINGAIYAPWIVCPPNLLTDRVSVLPPPPIPEGAP